MRSESIDAMMEKVRREFSLAKDPSLGIIDREIHLAIGGALCGEIIRIGSGNADILNDYGVVLGILGKSGKAIEYLNRAIDLAPENTAAYINRSRIREKACSQYPFHQPKRDKSQHL